ncbi:pseudouridine synthase [Cohnella thailandensis]|uniref:Pseudouridine synthase n=1 Tax=Cohnella thailandensis TaxID=557557 RepID=A0A841SUY8_9BACL|nr:pseudouridine synthase [Cohnella thailandensis]MBB6634018.1 rRNA pseudouridine synthase [Cohnella thailandensis]MBP1972703.1 16S rRNA pseudouridine516 synthase [Cohnella thailandensis]
MKKTIRLDKMLGNLGYGTRSGIKVLVKQGAISVNGARAKDPGMQIDPEADEVYLDGEKIVYRDTVYVLLNKPAGYVSATEDRRDRTVLELLDEEMNVFAPFPVGRLDKDTEGLLLLTNDGKLSHELLSPRKHVPKTYRALVEGEVGESDVALFREGVTLDDGYRTLPAELSIVALGTNGALPDHPDVPKVADRMGKVPALRGPELKEAIAAESPLSWIELTIREGKYHQVKRMFEAVGKKVLYLRRVAMGPLPLDEGLAVGEWRELTEEEVTALREYRKEITES